MGGRIFHLRPLSDVYGRDIVIDIVMDGNRLTEQQG
jgi:hypothetical protein